MRPTLALALLSLTATSCTYYDASLLGGPAGEGGAGAGSSSSSSASTGGAGGAGGSELCGHAQPVGPPGVTAAGGDLDIVVGFSEVDFGDRLSEDGTPDYKRIGYDLDGLCSCQGEGQSCLRASWATADACDGVDGRDNAAGALVHDIRTNYLADFGSETFTMELTEGRWTILLRIRGYNGLPDDDRVELGWYLPYGLGHAPEWDGKEAWPIRADSLTAPSGGSDWDLDAPKAVDSYAYVTGGVIVGSIPLGVLTTEKLNFVFTAAFLTARLVQSDGRWSLEDGVLAARWRSHDILKAFGSFELVGSQLCTDNLVYPKVKEKVCSYVDIFHGVGTPTSPCDSLSIGIGFRALPAKLGEIVFPEPDLPPCPPETDPGNDSCDSLAP